MIEKAPLKLVERSNDARHQSVEDCLAEAVERYNNDAETKDCKKCVVMFFGHPEKEGFMHWFFAGGTKVERIGWLEYIKNEISKTI